MKASEMTPRQRKALFAVREAASNIAAWENTLLDNPPESEEYKKAKAFLLDGESIRQEIYEEVINGIGEREIRFLGKPWIMERVEKQMIKFELPHTE